MEKLRWLETDWMDVECIKAQLKTEVMYFMTEG